ncbi:hypothetical protein CL621_01010 [archaeon]|nr:hypothetical protein [archaeon]
MQLVLNEDQISQIIADDPEIKYSIFRDDNGSLSIDESSNFPERLRFYMKKTGASVSDLVNYFRLNYPTLLSSPSSIHHYFRGVRTPKLSVLMGISEYLDIAPALLLPGIPGEYIRKEDNHVELILNDTPTTVVELKHEIPFIEANEVDDFLADIQEVIDSSNTLEEAPATYSSDPPVNPVLTEVLEEKVSVAEPASIPDKAVEELIHSFEEIVEKPKLEKELPKKQKEPTVLKVEEDLEDIFTDIESFSINTEDEDFSKVISTDSASEIEEEQIDTDQQFFNGS